MDGDPQMILEDVGSRVVRTISLHRANLTAKRGKCACTTPQGSARITLRTAGCSRRVWASGQYVYTLPRTSLAALRLDPCSPEENRTVTLTVRDYHA